MKTIVCKFGGSSLADAEQFRKVRAILEADPARRFVVVSAPGKRYDGDVKVTDLLLNCWEQAREGLDFGQELERVRTRFEEIIGILELDFDLDSEISIIWSVLRAMPHKSYMASRGEYLNAKIMAKYLDWPFIDPAMTIRFDAQGQLDAEMTSVALRQALKGLDHAVIAGFYGARADGSVQTFSRGGSDVTGAIVAEAADAELYENWTDVSGLLAADPRVIDEPHVAETITYRELRILSYMGASVMHTDAVYPVRKAGIPINIRNTNRPEDAGTMIVPTLPKDGTAHPIAGVTGRKGLSVVQVEKSMVSDGAGYSAVLLDIFKNFRIPFEQCMTGIDTISVVIRSDLFLPHKAEVLREVERQLAPDRLIVEEELSMIAVVGEHVEDAKDVTVRVLKAIADADVEIRTINQGAGDLNLIIGVSDVDYEKTIRAVYPVIG